MFIGHLPAGYVLTKTLEKNTKSPLFLTGLAASLLPDLDMAYFHFIDHRQHLHHGYWTHIPFYWFLLALVVFGLIRISGKKTYSMLAMVFFGNVFLHLFLDTIVGKIEWFFPFTNKAFYLFEVPAVYDYWQYNFIFHWTFLFEVGLILLAVFVSEKEWVLIKIRGNKALAPSLQMPEPNP